MHERVVREEFVDRMQAVFTAWVDRHDRIPTPEEAFKMMIDAGMPDATRAELEEAVARYMRTLSAND